MTAVFVGRGPELATLTSAVEHAVTGRGGLALISGEPGIGKSTLVAEVAARAAASGAEVHWGRCVELEGAPVYWSWRQVIRGWAEARSPAEVAAAMGTGLADVARIAPELTGICGVDADHVGGEDDGARFRLFDAVACWIRRAAAPCPLVLVLEDLQWADAASLRLLEFVAAGLSDTSALVLATYRDAEARPGAPLAQALGGLRRGPSTRQLALAGLTEADVAALARAAHGQALTPTAAAAVNSHTGGNPFFVTEVLRLLAAEGHLTDAESMRLHVPPGVRAVILRRVGQLGPDAEQVLTIAAVVGSTFDSGVVARVAERGVDVVDEILDRAVAVALLAEDGGGPNQYRFVHALVREALYEQIPRAQKATMHRAAGDALEALAGDDPESLAGLAAHFLAAASTGVAEKAMRYARQAARQAAGRLAHEEAVDLYRAALELWPARDARRADLLIDLGRAQFYAEDPDESRTSLLAAADVARALGDAQRMAAALLGIASGRFRGAASWDVPVPLLEENLRMLGDGDVRLRANLMSRLADMVTDRAARCGSRTKPWRWRDTRAIPAPSC